METEWEFQEINKKLGLIPSREAKVKMLKTVTICFILAGCSTTVEKYPLTPVDQKGEGTIVLDGVIFQLPSQCLDRRNIGSAEEQRSLGSVNEHRDLGSFEETRETGSLEENRSKGSYSEDRKLGNVEESRNIGSYEESRESSSYDEHRNLGSVSSERWCWVDKKGIRRLDDGTVIE